MLSLDAQRFALRTRTQADWHGLRPEDLKAKVVEAAKILGVDPAELQQAIVIEASANVESRGQTGRASLGGPSVEFLAENNGLPPGSGVLAFRISDQRPAAPTAEQPVGLDPRRQTAHEAVRTWQSAGAQGGPTGKAARQALQALGVDGVQELAAALGVTARVKWDDALETVTFNLLKVVGADANLVKKLAAGLAEPTAALTDERPAGQGAVRQAAHEAVRTWQVAGAEGGPTSRAARQALQALGLDGLRELAAALGITNAVPWDAALQTVAFKLLEVVGTNAELIARLAEGLTVPPSESSVSTTLIMGREDGTDAARGWVATGSEKGPMGLEQRGVEPVAMLAQEPGGGSVVNVKASASVAGDHPLQAVAANGLASARFGMSGRDMAAAGIDAAAAPSSRVVAASPIVLSPPTGQSRAPSSDVATPSAQPTNVVASSADGLHAASALREFLLKAYTSAADLEFNIEEVDGLDAMTSEIAWSGHTLGRVVDDVVTWLSRNPDRIHLFADMIEQELPSRRDTVEVSRLLRVEGLPRSRPVESVDHDAASPASGVATRLKQFLLAAFPQPTTLRRNLADVGLDSARHDIGWTGRSSSEIYDDVVAWLGQHPNAIPVFADMIDTERRNRPDTADVSRLLRSAGLPRSRPVEPVDHEAASPSSGMATQLKKFLLAAFPQPTTLRRNLADVGLDSARHDIGWTGRSSSDIYDDVVAWLNRNPNAISVFADMIDRERPSRNDTADVSRLLRTHSELNPTGVPD